MQKRSCRNGRDLRLTGSSQGSQLLRDLDAVPNEDLARHGNKGIPDLRSMMSMYFGQRHQTTVEFWKACA